MNYINTYVVVQGGSHYFRERACDIYSGVSYRGKGCADFVLNGLATSLMALLSVL